DPVRAVAMEVAREVLVERLSGRRSCPKDGASYHVKFTPPRREGVCDSCGTELVQREDDRPETVAKRFDEYIEKTAPLVDYYGKRGALRSVDGVGELEAVLDRITRALEA